MIEPERKLSLIYSIINYIPQILQWYFLGYKFTYSSGVEINIGAQKSKFFFNAAVTSDFSMSINTNDPYFLKINIVALFIVIILFDILDERKLIKKQNQEIDTILISPTHL